MINHCQTLHSIYILIRKVTAIITKLPIFCFSKLINDIFHFENNTRSNCTGYDIMNDCSFFYFTNISFSRCAETSESYLQKMGR